MIDNRHIFRGFPAHHGGIPSSLAYDTCDLIKKKKHRSKWMITGTTPMTMETLKYPHHILAAPRPWGWMGWMG